MIPNWLAPRCLDQTFDSLKSKLFNVTSVNPCYIDLELASYVYLLQSVMSSVRISLFRPLIDRTYTHCEHLNAQLNRPLNPSHHITGS